MDAHRVQKIALESNAILQIASNPMIRPLACHSSHTLPRESIQLGWTHLLHSKIHVAWVWVCDTGKKPFGTAKDSRQREYGLPNSANQRHGWFFVRSETHYWDVHRQRASESRSSLDASCYLLAGCPNAAPQSPMSLINCQGWINMMIYMYPMRSAKASLTSLLASPIGVHVHVSPVSENEAWSRLKLSRKGLRREGARKFLSEQPNR